jgi:hypothetical protein
MYTPNCRGLGLAWAIPIAARWPAGHNDGNSLETVLPAFCTHTHPTGKHHRAYVDNMNKQIAGTDLEGKSLEEVVLSSWNNGNPTPVFNNAAQVCDSCATCTIWHIMLGFMHLGVITVVASCAGSMVDRRRPPNITSTTPAGGADLCALVTACD